MSLLTRAAGRRSFRPVVGNKVAGHGESFIAGAPLTSGAAGIGENILAHALWASNGALRDGGNYGIGGQRSDEVLARLAATLATRPDALLLSGGAANDALQSVALATTKANYVSMAALIRASGIPCVVMGLPPAGASVSTAGRQFYARFNAWLRLWAPSVGLSFFDPSPYLNDPTTGYYSAATGMAYGDSIHPGPTGMRAAGVALAPMLTSLVAQVTSPLDVFELATDNLLLHGLFTADADSNGVADDWTAPSGLATSVSYTASRGTNAGVFGSIQSLAVADGNTGKFAQFQQTVSTGFAVGDRLGFGCVAISDGIPLDVYVVQNGVTIIRYAMRSTTAMTKAVCWTEFVVPAATTTLNIRLQVGRATQTGLPASVAGTGSFGQATLRNLTAAGL